jgi:predicted CopG family antitoxin
VKEDRFLDNVILKGYKHGTRDHGEETRNGKYTNLCMATKTVSLRESAYRKLKNLKREGESFSDVVERISSAQSLEQFEGSYPEIGEVKEELQEQREDFRTREME